jgi:hypothetical protein
MSVSVTQQADHFGLQPFRSEEAICISVPSEYQMEHPSMENFDPFGITEQKLLLAAEAEAPQDAPPKLNIKFSRHEEVASIAIPASQCEGASNCSIQGTLYAMVQCSDDNSNIPFIIPLDDLPETVEIYPHEQYSSLQQDDTISGSSSSLVVHIPKKSIGFVPVLHYKTNQLVEHMPILLERSITVRDTFCRVAAQVRSKLTNIGDMEDFTVAIAIPDTVDASSIEISRGHGVWNPTQRVIKFTLSSLAKGESFMVSAEMKLLKPLSSNNGSSLSFPIILRCSSIDDPISDLEFHAMETETTSCSIVVTNTSAFRLLHRLKP